MTGFGTDDRIGAFSPETRESPPPFAIANGERFFFVHLMKTAGTSFAFQLRDQFEAHEIYPSQGLDWREYSDIAGYVSIRRLMRLSPERRAEIRMYTGHFPFVVAELLASELRTLTLLRDPIERTVSVLKHFKRLSKRYRSFPLEEIYEDPFVFAHFIENHQTKMFSVTAEDSPEAFGSPMSYWATARMLGIGNPNFKVNPEVEIDRDAAIASANATKVDDRRFVLAMENLERVDVVGLSEHYDEFIGELRARFGWWPRGIDTRAKANQSREPWPVPVALSNRIAADNQYDAEFYEFAAELVAERSRHVKSRSMSDPQRNTGGGQRSPKLRSSRVRQGFRKQLRADIRSKHPRFFEAVVADAKITARYRSERATFHGRVDALHQIARLACVSDAFLGLMFYRAKARLQTLGVPVLPWIAHRFAMMTAQVCIGDPVVVRPGIYLAHGQVVIDGVTEVHHGAVIFPWVTIGLRAGDIKGPVIGRDVHIGTGAKVIGAVTLHKGARVGANAVVVTDVPADTTVVGAPARPTGRDASSL